MKKTVSVFLAFVLLLLSVPAAFAAEPAGLSFRPDGMFTILQLSDPQGDAYPAWGMLNLLERAVEPA